MDSLRIIVRMCSVERLDSCILKTNRLRKVSSSRVVCILPTTTCKYSCAEIEIKTSLFSLTWQQTELRRAWAEYVVCLVWRAGVHRCPPVVGDGWLCCNPVRIALSTAAAPPTPPGPAPAAPPPPWATAQRTLHYWPSSHKYCAMFCVPQVTVW